MEQIVLNIENKSILPSLERVLSSLDGVSVTKVPQKFVPLQIRPVAKKKKTELDLAIEDVQAGRVSQVFSSADELCRHLGI